MDDIFDMRMFLQQQQTKKKREEIIRLMHVISVAQGETPKQNRKQREEKRTTQAENKAQQIGESEIGKQTNKIQCVQAGRPAKYTQNRSFWLNDSNY